VRIFRKLAVAAAVGVVLPIVLGGIVRATGSGDACPDWPRCFGRWIPPGNYHAILEYSHRLLAAVSGLLLLALAVSLFANRDLRRRRSLVVPAIVAFVLLVIQSFLGKLVVERSLSPGLVTIHLATALLLAATVAVAAVNSYYVRIPPNAQDNAAPDGSETLDKLENISRTGSLALVSALSILAVILVGAYMRAESASLAFTDWPLMDGRIIPRLSGEPQLLHFAHRVLVLAGAIPIVWLSIRASTAKPRVRAIVAFAHLATALYILQVAIGAANVFTKLSQWARAAHVAVAAFAFMASVGCTAVCLNESKQPTGSRLEDQEVAAA
jgi:heme A synthase